MDENLRKLLNEEGLQRYRCGIKHLKKTPWRNRSKSRWGKYLRWVVVLGIWGTAGMSLLLFILFLQMPRLDTTLQKERKASIVIQDQSGQLIKTMNDIYGLPVEMKELPDYVWQAIVATEDRRFFYHFGIDPIGLMRAFVTNLFSAGIRQGGSTLTQQVAKNTFLSPERSMRRKLQELMVALWLEAKFTKEQILSMYLNRVSLVSGKYGINAASLEIFGKRARDLTIAESAIIAGMMKAPSKYHPFRYPEASEQRARLILKNMYDQKYIDGEQYAVALDSLKISKPQKEKSLRYFTDFVIRELRSHLGEIREDIIVRTTLNLDQQKQAEKVLRESLEENQDKDVSQGAVVILDFNGGVQALVGGKDYGQSQFNRATDARRQPGSSFKPFVYLAGLESGLTLDSQFIDQQISIGKWHPANFNNHYMGQVSLRTAFAHSLNSIPVQIAQQIGLRKIIHTAKRLGITSDLRFDMSIVLGSSELSLLELTSSYTPFANGGYGIMPHAILEVHNESGDLLYQRLKDQRPQVIVDPYLSMMTEIFKAPLSWGTAKKANFPEARGGKTGTSQDSRDAWFVGFTDQNICGVWVGNDSNMPMKKVYGGTIPAEIFKNILAK
ncbi:MAG: PBP1A family penicillin-binding protein [Alphaproteobacteria bacterium]|nr:PBP1A family penicillin-binding protein [Alphaproteobacteria bacterium]